MDTSTEALGRRLRSARKTSGIDGVVKSAYEAARRMGVPEGTYSGHDNGTRGFKLKSAVRYAAFYKVSVEWLLFGTGEPRPKDVMAQIARSMKKLPEKEQRKILSAIKALTEEAA